MRQAPGRSSLLFLAAWALPTLLLAQTGTALEGQVVDEAGGPLGGARVTATGLQAAEDYTAISDATGHYRIANPAPGLYIVSAEVTGFVTGVRSGVNVETDRPTQVDIPLRLLTLEELTRIEVKSASKLDQRVQEAPSVVSVIPREQSEAYGWRTLNDVLTAQPGFGPAQDYDRHTLGARGQFEGWNNNHVLHLVDGIPFNDNLYGTAYTWEITPLFLGKTVEILRGPGSALYGSYAANGVIQVNTPTAEDVKDKSEARLRVGNEGLRVVDWLTGYGAGNLLSGVVGFNAHTTDGNEYASLDGSGRADANGNLLRFTTNDRKQSRYFWARLDGAEALQGLSLQYHDQAWEYQTGHGWLWWVPDFRESMEEGRRIVALSYRPAAEGRLAQEYVVRYQRHEIDWNTRYYPNGAFDSYYPAGMWEALDTHADDVFARAQLTWKLGSGDSVLGGVEGDRFIYSGDREHNSNINVDDSAGGYPPFPDNQTTSLGPWLDFLLDEPVLNVAVYGQYSSGSRISKRVSLTAGARYDRTSFDFHQIYEEGRPTDSRTFERFSPRLGVVFVPSDRLSLKLLAGRAFRAPTPTELAGAHTFSLASNINELKPEVITTYEAAADWRPSRYVNVRGNVFLTRFENQIAYSAANFNLSTNIYTLETLGTELEILFSRGKWSGFANWSFARRQDEEIIDETVAPSPDTLTWAPAHRVNLGVTLTQGPWEFAASGHLEGSVERRLSDVGVQTLPLNFVDVDIDAFRDRTVDAWVRVDGKVAWRASRHLTLAVAGTNLFDGENPLVKVLPFPFDYRQEGRRVWGSVKVTY